MNLIADIGNTSTKLAIFDRKQKVSVSRINDLNCKELDNILDSGKISRAIVSSVKILPPFISDLLQRRIPEVLVLSHRTRLPFSIRYDTPETLGSDRIAAVAGAFERFPGKEILIIDAGTAITFDFLSGSTYKGGNISPGLTMRFRALNFFTGQLPLVNLSENCTSPGLNTNQAIAAGVISGVLYEINEYIRTFEKNHPGSEVILSGGDGQFLAGKLESKVNYLPEVVIDGLNYILEYNAQ